jgi:hypothetical protein
MRSFGFKLRHNTSLSAVKRPGHWHAQAPINLNRRLDDALVVVFDRACETGNLDAAKDILAVLEKWAARRASKYGTERRMANNGIEAMRAELERLSAPTAKH